MLLPLIISAWILVLSSAAPAQLLYTAPVVRFQQSVIQPIVAAPNPVLVYQGLPLGYQLRQLPPFNNTFDQFGQIFNQFQDVGSQAFQQLQDWSQDFTQSWAPGMNERLPASTAELKPMLTERYDTQKPNMELLNPEMKTKMAPANEQKQYLALAGYPQLYYDFVQPAYSPAVLSLQPLQAIRARSMADPNQIKNDKFLAQVAPRADDVAVADPIVPAAIVPLAEPLKSIAVPELPIAEPVVDVQPEQPVIVVEPVQPATSYAKFLQDNQVDPEVSSRSQPDEPSKLNDVVKAVKEDEASSIAQAMPVAAAVAGKAGHAQAEPIATAIVGKDSLAIAQPIATAVSGEFGSSDLKVIDEKVAVEPSKDKVE